MQNSQFWQNNFKRTKSCPDTMQWMPFFSRTSSRWWGWRGGRRPFAVGQDLPVLPFFVIRSFDACVETLLRSWGTIWVAVALCCLSFFPRKKKTDSTEQGRYQKLLSSVLAIATARECQNFVSCRPVKSWKGKVLAQACGAGILCSTARALT